MSDSLFYWEFHSVVDNDVWYGFTYADTNYSDYGRSWWSQWPQFNGTSSGYYVVTGETAYNHDLSDYHGNYYADGSTYVYRYYDAQTRAFYTPVLYSAGQKSGASGIGSEYDQVILNGKYDDFGLGYTAGVLGNLEDILRPRSG